MMVCSPLRAITTFNGPNNAISQKTELFVTTIVRILNPANINMYKVLHDSVNFWKVVLTPYWVKNVKFLTVKQLCVQEWYKSSNVWVSLYKCTMESRSVQVHSKVMVPWSSLSGCWIGHAGLQNWPMKSPKPHYLDFHVQGLIDPLLFVIHASFTPRIGR
jgi:hypothetical protein